MEPQFSSLDDGTGLEVIDPIEGVRVVIPTSEEVSPVEAASDGFAQPVSTACKITASEFRVNGNCAVTLNDVTDGSVIESISYLAERTLPSDKYLFGIATKLTLYIDVTSEISVDGNSNQIRFEFENSTDIRIGARSLHRKPAGTITVPDDPRALMQAVSAFGSALKTTSPERSWSTLRGHPPRIERGETLDIPANISIPKTGVSIHVPPDYEHIYPVVPLAYYLGAKVVSGDPPRLTTESGFVHRLDTDRGFETEVARILKQVFLFDCVARGFGYFHLNLHERQVLVNRSTVELDFGSLSDEPLTEQLRQYLSVPYAAIADLVPNWSRVTYVRPDPLHTPILSYLANDLSVVRTELPGEPATPTPVKRRNESVIAAFKRDESQKPNQIGDGDRRESSPQRERYVPIPEVDASEVAWVGDETPERGSKLMIEAFERNRPKPKEASIDVTVVCNDEEMMKEQNAVAERYGVHQTVPFDVTLHEHISVAELRNLFVDETDLLHYIGHIEENGIKCSDGWLDATTLDETRATTVLLNACRSHSQGTALVEAGASAAIVSLGDVENIGAVEVGEKFAGLLNFGFPVGSALSLVSEVTSIGRQYIVLGNPNVSVAQCVDGSANLRRIVSKDDEEIDVKMQSYATNRMQVGSAFRSHLSSDETYHLTPASYDIGRVNRTILHERLNDGSPLVVDGELTWLDDDTL